VRGSALRLLLLLLHWRAGAALHQRSGCGGGGGGDGGCAIDEMLIRVTQSSVAAGRPWSVASASAACGTGPADMR